MPSVELSHRDKALILARLTRLEQRFPILLGTRGASPVSARWGVVVTAPHGGGQMIFEDEADLAAFKRSRGRDDAIVRYWFGPGHRVHYKKL